MNASKILFATDFSPTSDTALEVATSLARSSGATLIVAHVNTPLPPYGGEGMMVPLTELDAERGREELNGVKVPDASVPVQRELLLGNPAPEIVNLADKEKADLIVIGSHGRTGLSRLLMGSVAEAVVRLANCPVLTVKPKAVVGSEEPAIWEK
jgi:universal stress protein A